MSYAQGTENYGFPQFVGSDRPTFVDFNAAFRTIDTKLFALEGDSSTTDGRLDTIEAALPIMDAATQSAQNTADSAKAEADTNAEHITALEVLTGHHTTQIANKLDSVAIAEQYDPNAGTYAIGDIVVYNGQRYKCITAVAVAEPFDADKWIGEDVETVLNAIKDSIESLNPTTLATVTADGVASYSNLLNNIYSQLNVSFGDFRKLVFSLATGGTLMVFEPADYNGTQLRFSKTITNSTTSEISTVEILETGSHFYAYNAVSGTVTDLSSTVPANGSILSVVLVP